jgi:hypothetical protein
VFAVERAVDPAPAVDGFQRVVELVVAGGASVQEALAGALIPHAAVVILGNFHAAVLALAKRLAKRDLRFAFPIGCVSVTPPGDVFQFTGAFR